MRTQSVDKIAAAIMEQARHAERFMVAIVGPPGAGKSTLSQRLACSLPSQETAILQADGFHYDNAVLDVIGRRDRKGAEDTFDCKGLELTLRRLRSREHSVAVPVFDRELDVARAGAALIAAHLKYILIEGNYLLLDKPPWAGLMQFFDFSVSIEVPRPELEHRLMQRWLILGRTPEAARHWVDTNDIPNIDLVLQASRPASMILDGGGETIRRWLRAADPCEFNWP